VGPVLLADVQLRDAVQRGHHEYAGNGKERPEDPNIVTWVYCQL
jgi:hypothetical protein